MSCEAMSSTTLRALREDHAATTMALLALSRALEHHAPGSTLPDFQALRSILAYLTDLSEKQHHLGESEVLFPIVRAHVPALGAVIDHLEREHAGSDRQLRQLEQALEKFEERGDEARAEFENAAERYTSFYLAHINMEECAVLPLAQEQLMPDEWARIDAAFADHRLRHAPDARSARERYADLMTAISGAIGTDHPPH